MANFDNIEKLMIALLDRLNDETDSSELYGDYLLRWFETYKKPINEPNTSKSMLSYITDRIIPALGEIQLCRLSGDKIQAFLNGIPKGNTRNKIADIIKGSLTKAVKLRLLRYNPFDAVEVKNYKKKHYRALTLQEQAQLLNAITNKLYIAVFYVLICTGMRIGEFLALDRASIDYDNRLINVYKSVDVHSGELRERTKTYTSTRSIPFLPMLEKYISVVLGYGRRLSYNQVKKYFQKVYKKVGSKGLNLHSFRHTFGCMCYHVGMSEKLIQHLMGHSSLDVTMNVYVDILGNGESPFLTYFKKYKKDLESRPPNFWRFSG